jgi:uncharacterized protein
MARDFPDWLNPRAAAEGRRTFEGTVPLRRLNRLNELLYRDDAQGSSQSPSASATVESAATAPGGESAEEVSFKAHFTLDEERRAVIDLEVGATVQLLCQASLEPYWQVLARRSRLGVIDDEAEIDLLPADYDPVMTDHGRLALQTLVEDELLLALPQVPRNPELDAVQFSTGDANEEAAVTRPNPFAELRGKLKG